MVTFLLVFHVIMAFLIIGLVLIQHGKGAEVGAAFGSGASNTMFGSAGSGSFLAKFTIVLAILFAVSSFGLTKFAYKSSKSNVIDVDSLVLPEGNSKGKSSTKNQSSKQEDADFKPIPLPLEVPESEVPKMLDRDSSELPDTN